jgi:flagellar motor switch protein FliG
MEMNQLSGSLKAAILIHSMGRPAAERILNRLTRQERELVNRHMDQMGAISSEVVEQVAKEFTARAQRARSTLQKPSAAAGGAGKTLKQAGVSASEVAGLKALLALNADEVFDLIKEEHPQTIAIILIHLSPPVASDVISKMPDEIKADVALRITSLEKVNASMVEEINQAFAEILKNKKTVITNVSGGVDRLAEILNQADEISSELILNEIEEADAELAAEIKQKMFVFEDLVLVNDRGFQKLLRKVETVELAIALKAASEEVKEKVFRNMSERAGEMLIEEMESLGPIRMKEVLDSQQNITNIIQEMEGRGEIIIAGRRGEEIIE